MKEAWTLKTIAYIHTDFPAKFGIPRQSGLVDAKGQIVLEAEYRSMDAVRELEQYSHLWLIWGFSANKNSDWRATVRPPRLGGNVRMGVFATRSPYRPNPLGLSCVEFIGIEQTETEGTVIVVAGADMLDNTPIYDIKPYIPYADSHPDAKGGFAADKPAESLRVEISDALLSKLPEQKRGSLISVLAQDPRPAYQNDPERIYGLCFAGFDLHFVVKDDVLTVLDLSSKK